VLVNVYQLVLKKERRKAGLAHTYNPSHSGDGDQEDHGSKPAWADSAKDLILKILNTKQGWWSGSSGRAPAECESLSSKASTAKKKKKKKDKP
jgi:hypothetical protein